MDSNSPASLSFFLAGTMQGSRKGADQISQSYRAQLAEVIRRNCPDARVLCPLEELVRILGPQQAAVQASHGALSSLASVRRADFDAPLLSLTQAFDSLSRAAGTVDVLIAYLPDHEASMGTAIEMWNAYTRGVTVISITPMRQNLAVLSTSTVIIPDVEALDLLFKDGFFHALEASKSGKSERSAATLSPN